MLIKNNYFEFDGFRKNSNFFINKEIIVESL
jgi:hypothetical protein